MLQPLEIAFGRHAEQKLVFDESVHLEPIALREEVPHFRLNDRPTEPSEIVGLPIAHKSPEDGLAMFEQVAVELHCFHIHAVPSQIVHNTPSRGAPNHQVPVGEPTA
jgi:hypothetical protein